MAAFIPQPPSFAAAVNHCQQPKRSDSDLLDLQEASIAADVAGLRQHHLGTTPEKHAAPQPQPQAFGTEFAKDSVPRKEAVAPLRPAPLRRTLSSSSPDDGPEFTEDLFLPTAGVVPPVVCSSLSLSSLSEEQQQRQFSPTSDSLSPVCLAPSPKDDEAELRQKRFLARIELQSSAETSPEDQFHDDEAATELMTDNGSENEWCPGGRDEGVQCDLVLPPKPAPPKAPPLPPLAFGPDLRLTRRTRRFSAGDAWRQLDNLPVGWTPPPALTSGLAPGLSPLARLEPLDPPKQPRATSFPQRAAGRLLARTARTRIALALIFVVVLVAGLWQLLLPPPEAAMPFVA